MTEAPNTKGIITTYNRCRELARQRCTTDLLRQKFMKTVEDCKRATTTELCDIVREALLKSKVRDAHRKVLEQDLEEIKSLCKDGEVTNLSSLPSELLGALTIHLLSACDNALRDIDESLVSTDAELQRLLESSPLTPDSLLQNEYQKLKENRGSRFSLIVQGQSHSRHNRQLLVEVLEQQNTLSVICLNNCSFRDTDLEILLPALRGMQHLRVLSLEGNILSGSSLELFVKVLNDDPESFPILQSLNLSGNEIPDESVDQLQQMVADRFTSRNSQKEDGWILNNCQYEVDSKKKIKILTLDGGHARNLAQVELLEHIEDNLPDHQTLNDVFDIIVGSGLGATIAAAIRIGRPISTIKTTLKKIATDVFSTQDWSLLWAFESAYRGIRSYTFGDWYPGSTLSYILQSELFGSAKLSDIPKPVILVGSDPEDPNSEICFTNFTSNIRKPRTVCNPDDELSILCRAVAASPGFFHPVSVTDGMCRDGGVAHQNPAIVALSTLAQQVALDRLVFVSVGCGTTRVVENEDTLLLKRLERNESSVVPLSSPEPPHLAMRSLSELSCVGLTYHRVNPTPVRPLLLDYSNFPFDECHSSSLDMLTTAARDFVDQNTTLLNAVVDEFKDPK
eukprot:TRINITY_DN24448_c0_g1_i1.p1 TRINITY_DN24448_c0_g1~~TRINITY_DN24448_c0_g1_i1.p1  ORF type:complete len:623 (+),score=107.22 TRINITY_DN24448_c0_g1_i1:73-1941(+)